MGTKTKIAMMTMTMMMLTTMMTTTEQASATDKMGRSAEFLPQSAALPTSWLHTMAAVCSQGGHQKFQGALLKYARGNSSLVSPTTLGQTSASDRNHTQHITPIQHHTQRVGIRTPVGAIRL